MYNNNKTKCENLEENANCKVTLKKFWCVDYYGQIVNWPGKKSKSNNKKGKKKFENCFGRLVDIQHPISLSQSGAIVIILNIGFPWAKAAKIVIIWGVQTCYEYQRCSSFHFFMVSGLSRLMICFRGWLAVNITSIIPSLFPDRAHGT